MTWRLKSFSMFLRHYLFFFWSSSSNKFSWGKKHKKDLTAVGQMKIACRRQVSFSRYHQEGNGSWPETNPFFSLAKVCSHCFCFKLSTSFVGRAASASNQVWERLIMPSMKSNPSCWFLVICKLRPVNTTIYIYSWRSDEVIDKDGQFSFKQRRCNCHIKIACDDLTSYATELTVAGHFVSNVVGSSLWGPVDAYSSTISSQFRFKWSRFAKS
jgi:hypothetical protein